MEPLVQEIAPKRPAHALFAALAGRPYPFFLDSGMDPARHGRFSFIGCEPFLVLRSRGQAVETMEKGQWRRCRGDPLEMLQAALERYSVPRGDYPVPFVGGAVGYLGYDLGRLIERLPGGPVEDLPVPESYLCFYDALVAFDHALGRAYLLSTGQPAPAGPGRRARAERRLAWLGRLIEEDGGLSSWCGTAASSPGAELCSNFSREEYLRAVQRAREYIVAGDIYQVNLSQRFQAPWAAAPWELYQRLRAINHAPFAAYLDFGELAVVSASPERFLKLEGATIETRPIKGTRPRGRTPQEDRRLASELVASQKDRAEHIMIVDLERSDLGRVSETGSVTVDELMALEQYATVYHLTSTIRGRLRPGRTLAELLRATFPGGSITGAPKIRAMEIIDELEPTRRGVYTGSIGYFGFTGDLDLNIAIRTIVVKDGRASFQVGGGIVYDSDPEAEFQETLDKGRALMAALAG